MPTYVAGAVIDWSGVTGIALCQFAGCGDVLGPYFTRDDTKQAALDHRDSHHFGAQPPPAAAIPFDLHRCDWTDDCDQKATVRGYCKSHSAKALRWERYGPPAPKEPRVRVPKARKVRVPRLPRAKHSEDPDYISADPCSRCGRDRWVGELCQRHYFADRRAAKRQAKAAA